MEVIDTYFDARQLSDREIYRIWKYNRGKYFYWLKCKRQNYQMIDPWDQYILSTMNTGKTVVYDSSAPYWTRLAPNVEIVENYVPPQVASYVTLYDHSVDERMKGTVNNLILFSSLSIKLTTSLYDYLTVPMQTRSGFTPKLVDWFAKDVKIYMSIGQEFFSFNRFKLTLDDFIQQEAQRLEQDLQLKLVFKKHTHNDTVNGNIKLLFERA
jgi:hypothetical protein